MLGRMDDRRRKLQYRSDYTGTRETDLLLGSFARRHLANLSERQLDEYEALLEIEDPRLFKWISGMEEPPERYRNDVFQMIREYRYHP